MMLWRAQTRVIQLTFRALEIVFPLNSNKVICFSWRIGPLMDTPCAVLFLNHYKRAASKSGCSHGLNFFLAKTLSLIAALSFSRFFQMLKIVERAKPNSLAITIFASPFKILAIMAPFSIDNTFLFFA